ncbi:baseplate assembly protein [Viridibacillus arvi]|uniref:baseplate assembly protein n=1 Tax=Viridibacillus arvi TaxID=263475 RepID=UPI0034CDE97D
MAARFELPDFYFLDPDIEEIEQEMIFYIEEKTGAKLTNSLPKRKFVQAMSVYISQKYYQLDHALKQALITYAQDEPLDHKGEEVQTPRLDQQYSTTQLLINLEPERPSLLKISKGKRAVVGEDIFFATTKDESIPVGQDSIVVEVKCTEPGEFANGYLPGEITQMVDVIPYVTSVKNITTTAGGTNVEDDDNYAERIRIAPEKFSTAGPEGAYEYWAKSANQLIEDVEVTSPSPGVTQLTILLKDGEIPSEDILSQVETVCSDKKVRPLTDNVVVKAPEIVNYTPIVEYYLSKDKAPVATAMQAEIQKAFNAYLKWQRSKMGRDVDMSEVIANLRIAGAQRIIVKSEMFIEIDKHMVARDLDPVLTFAGIANE